MTSKNKNIVQESSEIYQPTPKIVSTSEDLHPVLVKLLEKSIQEANDGKLISHEDVMKRIKEKIASLK